MSTLLKLAVSTVVVAANVQADVIMPDFELDLEARDIDQLKEIAKQDINVAFGVDAFTENYRAHMWDIRNNYKHTPWEHEIVRYESLKYYNTVYKLILTELARCIFDIKGGMIEYTDDYGKILKCKGGKPIEQYDQSNWNYVVFVNVLNRIIHKNNYEADKIEDDINEVTSKLKTKYRPLFKYDHDFLSYWRKNELINVAMENLNIYNRLNSKKGTYTLKNHLKDYERAQYYKKNYCKFPSIDFYRTSKASDSNLCPIFNYCTFYNYKTINDKFTNECLKRTNSQIMFKTKSVSELFNIEKNRKKKTFHLSPFKNKYNKNEEVKSEKNNVKHIFNNVRNDIYKNSGKSKDIKKEEDKKEEIPENNENNNVVNKEEDNINQNNNINDDIIDENIKKDNENKNSNNSLKNLEDEIINTNDINDNNDKNDNNDINDNKEMIPNSNNKLKKFLKKLMKKKLLKNKK